MQADHSHMAMRGEARCSDSHRVALHSTDRGKYRSTLELRKGRIPTARDVLEAHKAGADIAPHGIARLVRRCQQLESGSGRVPTIRDVPIARGVRTDSCGRAGQFYRLLYLEICTGGNHGHSLLQPSHGL